MGVYIIQAQLRDLVFSLERLLHCAVPLRVDGGIGWMMQNGGDGIRFDTSGRGVLPSLLAVHAVIYAPLLLPMRIWNKTLHAIRL